MQPSEVRIPGDAGNLPADAPVEPEPAPVLDLRPGFDSHLRRIRPVPPIRHPVGRISRIRLPPAETLHPVSEELQPRRGLPRRPSCRPLHLHGPHLALGWQVPSTVNESGKVAALRDSLLSLAMSQRVRPLTRSVPTV